MTAYTSFLAVDHSHVANVSGDMPKKVKQVLPMPAGVYNSAIGFDLKISNVSKPAKLKPLKLLVEKHIDLDEDETK